MAILDDLTSAAEDALAAGAKTARHEGKALGDDFEKLVRPNLEAVIAQMAQITEDLAKGDIGQDQAKDDLATQFDAIPPLILAETELLLEAVQDIINAVIGALKAAINTAAKVPLL
jgi:hypothetical protein